MKLDPLPLNQVFTLSRDEFALYIEQARRDGLDSIFDVDFSRMSDEQALLILDVLFKNKKKGVKQP